MHIHILGICGTFMGGIAAIAREAGHRVTGCDANVYPPMSDQLQSLGIELIQGFDPAQVDLAPDVFVIGNAISRGNPLLEEILNLRLAYTSGPQWLADFVLGDRHVLAVAGTHGKTSTTAMLAWILECAGVAPGFLIGGVPKNFGVSARLGGGEGAPRRSAFVIEADEYDTAFFDKRSKFVHYRPSTAVLNNLEFDHADIFPDLAAIETQFHHLVRTVPTKGRIVVNAQAPALARVLARGCWSQVEPFGSADDQGLWAQPLSAGSFFVMRGTLKLARVDWELMGAHNEMNALAAIGAAGHLGVSVVDAAKSLGSFLNVARRMEFKGQEAGVRVIDDFAHHPTAIRTTLEGLRSRVGSNRILAVFEPRSNTMKLGSMKAELPDALASADHAFCFAGGLDWDAAAALEPMKSRASVHSSMDELVQAVVSMARPGDHVLCMSNGGFGGVHSRLLAALRERAHPVAHSAQPR